MPDFDIKKIHDRIKQKSFAFDYFIRPVAFIYEVDNERRKTVKETGARYISMLNYGDIFLLIFKIKKNV